MTAIVTMHLFSGLRNPYWELSDADIARFQTLLTNMQFAAAHLGGAPAFAIGADERRRVAVDRRGLPIHRPEAIRSSLFEEESDLLMLPFSGFRGFEVVFAGSPDAAAAAFHTYDRLILNTATGRLLRDANDVAFEEQLYATAPPAVVKQLDGMTYGDVKSAGHESPIIGLDGPDHRLACESSPIYPGHVGPWKTHTFDNNCYNYATNALAAPATSPAVPGPGDRLLLHLPLTDGTLRRALDADELKDLGSSLPSKCPPPGSHYIVVVMRHHPVSAAVRDFHCIRLDRAGTWSHKDGRGPVRKVDDADQPITDLSGASFKWNPSLIGVYLARYSKRRLID